MDLDVLYGFANKNLIRKPFLLVRRVKNFGTGGVGWIISDFRWLSFCGSFEPYFLYIDYKNFNLKVKLFYLFGLSVRHVNYRFLLCDRANLTLHTITYLIILFSKILNLIFNVTKDTFNISFIRIRWFYEAYLYNLATNFSFFGYIEQINSSFEL